MPSMFTGSGGQSQSSSYNSSTTTNVNYPSWLEDFAKNIATSANGLVNAPFQSYDVNKMFAPFQPAQNQAFNQVGANQTSWQPYFNNATGALNSGSTAANGYFNQAGASTSPTAAAQPYMNTAAQSWNSPGVAQSYMNPYLANSVNYANQLASQNFTQNVMPRLTQQFVAGGGGGDGSRGALGSPQYQKAADWALTNFNNAIAGNTQNAMAQGYFNSANQFQQDQARQAGLANTAGNLAATGTGLLTNLGTAQNNAGATNAGVFGQLGNSFSNNNLQNTNALLQVGNQQQQQAQNPLTFNYQQFLNQQNWPYQLLSWGTGIESGLRTPMTTTSNTQGSSTTTGSANSSASPFGSIIGGLSALGGSGAFGSRGWLSGLGSSLFSSGGGVPSIDSEIASWSQYHKKGGHVDKPKGHFANGGTVAADGVPEFGIGGFFGNLLGGIFGNQKLGGDIGQGADLALQFLPMLLEEGGHLPRPRNYATGGLAVVSKAGRAETRNDVRSAERRQGALDAAQNATRRPLASGAGFFGGSKTPPAFMISASQRPGFLSNGR